MAGTINAANVSIRLDYQKLKDGVDASRAELSKLAGHIKASIPATEQYARQTDLLRQAFKSGAINATTYAQTLDHLKTKFFGPSLFAKMTTGIGAAAAAYVSYSAAVGMARSAMATFTSSATEIDRIADASHKLSISYKDLVTLRMSLAETSGMDEGSVDGALTKMQLNLGKARDEGGKLADHLKAIGLDAGKLLEAGPVKAMQILSTTIGGMKDPTDQLRLSMEIFGKGGVDLISSLRGGPEALQSMADHAERFGLALSEEQAEQVGAMNDELGRVQSAFEGITNQFVAEFSPVITMFAKELTAANGPLEKISLAIPSIVDATTQWVLLLGRAAQGANAVWSAFEPVVSASASVFGALQNVTPQGMLANFQTMMDGGKGYVENLAKIELEKANATNIAAARSTATSKSGLFAKPEKTEEQLTKEAAAADKKYDAEKMARHKAQRKKIDEEYAATRKFMETQAATLKKQQAEVKAMADKYATPAQKMRDEFAEIARLETLGLDPSVGDRARDEIRGKQAEEEMKDKKFGAVSALKDSVEGYKLLLADKNEARRRDVTAQKSRDTMVELLGDIANQPNQPIEFIR